MEIVIPSMEFDFNSARSSPRRPSAPSSPKRFGEYYYTSAPTSPSRISEFYRDFDNLYGIDDSSSSSSAAAVPFGWEQSPGTPRSPKADHHHEFAFDFSSNMEQASLTADQLFDGGRIRPLKPPPRLHGGGDDEYPDGQKSPLLSPRSPKSPNPFSQGKKIVRDAFSPRNKKKANDNPFAVGGGGGENTEKRSSEHERGRQRRNDSSSGSRRASRSLSPYRVSEYPWEEEEKQYQRQQQQKQQQQQQQPIKQSSSNSKLPPPHPPSSSSTKSSSRKWRFTDFLLFRSASEGRAAEKDPLRKYSGFKKNEEIRNTTRSSEGSGSGRRKGQVSAHELHYTKNKAASQDLKKKTFLPYKSGILGFHGFTRS